MQIAKEENKGIILSTKTKQNPNKIIHSFKFRTASHIF